MGIAWALHLIGGSQPSPHVGVVRLTLVILGMMLAGCSSVRAQHSSYFGLRGPVPEDPEGFSSALLQSVGVATQPGHTVEFVENGTVFDAIEREVRAAKRSVHVLVYIWRAGEPGDRIVRALAERAREGIQCRVVVDDFGSPFFEEVRKPLADGGCDVRIFRPLPAEDNVARNHRKMVIVDAAVGITGGFGIMEPWKGNGRAEDEWRDSNVRVTGPAVHQMQLAFAENWQEAGGDLLPPEELKVPKATGEVRAAFVASRSLVVTEAERLTHLAIHSARKRLWIANSYFVPNEALIDALVRKKKAGVDVRVLVPGDRNDVKPVTTAQRATYDSLLPHGIRIWEYQPGMMHAKTMLIDEGRVIVGSINLDPLSLGKLEEGSVVAESPELAKRLEALWLEDLRYAKEILPDAE